MAEQTIPLSAGWWLAVDGRVQYRPSSRPQIDAILTPENDDLDRYLFEIVFLDDGTARASFSSTPSAAGSLRADLSSLFENQWQHHAHRRGITRSPLRQRLTTQAILTTSLQAMHPKSQPSSRRLSRAGRWMGTLVLRDFVPSILPDAEAPTVAIDTIANHNEGSTVTLGATLTGGTYDTVDYLWSIDSGGGTIDDPTAETPVYTDPDVSFNTSVTLRLTITANGTGTNAADGTSDTASDTEQFAVFFVADIPDAVAHAVNAGESAFAFAVPQPTVTHTAAPTVELVLSDFDLADGVRD